MDAIRFEPAIGTDFAIDRRQDSNAGDMFADMLGEQLKKRGESERIESAARRRSPTERRQAADPQGAHGRPIRPVIKHPPTLRGEAKPVAEDRPQLAARKEEGAAPACMDTEEAATVAPVNEADEASGPEIRETGQTETAAETTATAEATGETTAETIAETTGETMGQAAAAGEVPLAAVTVPPADTGAAPLEVEAADMAADSTQPDSIVPGEAAAPQAANGETTDTEAAAAPTAAGFAAALAASQEQTAAAALGDGGGTTAGAMQSETASGSAIPAAVPAGSAADMTAAVATENIADLASAETAEAAAMTVKMTPETPRSAEPAKSRPAPAAAQAEIKAQAPAATPAPQAPMATQPTPPAQSTAVDESAANPFDSSVLDADGSGMPGWSLHLAQGAAAKRPDFVAQLRQHLQDLPAHEQVAVNIQRALREGTGRLSIQLSPAELGKIHVKLDIDEEKRVTAAVTVEKPSTLELLQRDMKALERALHDAGLKMEGGDLSFSLGRQDGKEFSQDAGNSGRPAYGAGQAEDQVEAETQAASAAQVDTAAGVVNLEV